MDAVSQAREEFAGEREDTGHGAIPVPPKVTEYNPNGVGAMMDEDGNAVVVLVLPGEMVKINLSAQGVGNLVGQLTKKPSVILTPPRDIVVPGR